MASQNPQPPFDQISDPHQQLFRELVLYADRVKSRNLHFLLDRDHVPNGVSDPALFVLLNATSEQHRSGITQLLQDISRSGFDAANTLPSLVAGDSLYVLDSTYGWTPDESPKFIIYNFVKKRGDRRAQQLLDYYRALPHIFSATYPGCAFRIPLDKGRIASVDSEMGSPDSKQELSVVGITTLFQEASKNLAEYLLFVKNIEEIKFQIYDDDFRVGAQISTHVENGWRSELALAYDEVFQSGSRASFDLVYCLRIHTETAAGSAVSDWIISRCALRSLEKETDAFARENSVIPEVAVAMPRDMDPKGFSGMIFDPTPWIKTTHLIHMFGSFIRQSQANNSGGRYPLKSSSIWNSKLLELIIPRAWANLLLHMQHPTPGSELSYNSPKSIMNSDERFHYWPNVINDGKNWEGSVTYSVVRHVLDHNLAVWPTARGQLSIEEVLFARAMEPFKDVQIGAKHFRATDQLRFVLRVLEIPICYAPEAIYDAVLSTTSNFRPLTAALVAAYVRRDLERLKSASEVSKTVLMDYLLSQPLESAIACLISLPLVPICDGSRRQLEFLDVLKLPTGTFEAQLFNKAPERTIDLSRLSRRTIEKLISGETMTGIEPWSIEDVPEYCARSFFFPAKHDAPKLDQYQIPHGYIEFVARLWKWITERYSFERVAHHVGQLWIVPLTDGAYRKLLVSSDAQILLDPGDTPIGKFLQREEFSAFPFYQDTIGSEAKALLKSQRILRDCTLENVVQWLSVIPGAITLLKSTLRQKLCRLLVDMAKEEQIQDADLRRIGQSLETLELFQELRNSADGVTANYRRLSVNATYGLVDMDRCVPELEGVVFLRASPECRQLAETFKLAEVPDARRLLLEYVIPSLWKRLPPATTQRLGEYLLQQLNVLEDAAIAELSVIPFIPASSKDGTITRLRPPMECVVYQSSAAGCFLSREVVWIPDAYREKHSTALSRLSLISIVDSSLIEQRVRAFIHPPSGTSTEDLAAAAKALIQTSSDIKIPQTSEIVEAQWIPAVNEIGELGFCNSSQCRDITSLDIVGRIMALVPFDVGPNWRTAFGWNDDLPINILESRLKQLITESDTDELLELLNYLLQSADRWDCLKDRACLPSITGELYSPERLFFTGASTLGPRFGQIHPQLPQHRQALLKLGVQEQPSFARLQEISHELPEPMSGDDLKIATACCNTAALLYPDMDFSQFGVPDWKGYRRTTSAVVADNPHDQFYKEGYQFVHPDITQRTVQILRIPWIRELRAVEESVSSDYLMSAIEQIWLTLQVFNPENVLCFILAYLARLKKCSTVEFQVRVADDADAVGFDGTPPANGPFRLIVRTDADCECFLSTVTAPDATDTWDMRLCALSNSINIVSNKTFILFDPDHHSIPYVDRHQNLIRCALKSMQELHQSYLQPFYALPGFDTDTDQYKGSVLILNLKAFSNPGLLWGDVNAILRKYKFAVPAPLLFVETVHELRYVSANSINWEYSKREITLRKNGFDYSEPSDFRVYTLETEDSVQSTWALAKLRGAAGDFYQMAVYVNGKMSTTKGGFYDSFMKFSPSSSVPAHIQLLTAVVDSHFTDGCLDDDPRHLHNIGKLYFNALGFLASHVGEQSYRFWPSYVAENGLLETYFWSELSKCNIPLFPIKSPKPAFGEELRTVTFAGATFNLQDANLGITLERLLHEAGTINIVRPTKDIQVALKSLGPEVNLQIIDATFIRETLKSSQGSDALRQLWELDGFSSLTVNAVLAFIMNPDPHAIELNGCLCLPLMDCSIAPLKTAPRIFSGQTISDLLLYNHNQRPLLEYAASRCLHPCLGPMQDQLARLGSEIRSLSFSDIPNIVRKVCADDISEYRTFLQHLWRVINSDLLDQYNPRLLHRLPVYWASLDSDYPAITPES